MKKSELIELIKQVVKEENDYQELLKTMLNKSGKSIESMSDDEKKKFFNAVDKAYKAKQEGKLRGYNELTDKQKQIDVDKDGEIEGSDLAALRSKNEQKKKVSKMINPQKGMDSSTIDKIVKMPLVQSQISKQIGSKNSNIDKTEIENQLKTIISKSWNDLSSKVMDKVKNDLKK